MWKSSQLSWRRDSLIICLLLNTLLLYGKKGWSNFFITPCSHVLLHVALKLLLRSKLPPLEDKQLMTCFHQWNFNRIDESKSPKWGYMIGIAALSLSPYQRGLFLTVTVSSVRKNPHEQIWAEPTAKNQALDQQLEARSWVEPQQTYKYMNKNKWLFLFFQALSFGIICYKANPTDTLSKKLPWTNKHLWIILVDNKYYMEGTLGSDMFSFGSISVYTNS